MKISRRELRQIVEQEEKAILNEEKLNEAQSDMVAEGLGKLLKSIPGAIRTGAQVVSSAGTFVTGIRKFLQANKDWIEPLWVMVKDMREAQQDGPQALPGPSGDSESTDLDISSADSDGDGDVDIDDFDVFTTDMMMTGDSSSSDDPDTEYEIDIDDIDDMIAEANSLYRSLIPKNKRGK